jgi:hypothetical protein
MTLLNGHFSAHLQQVCITDSVMLRFSGLIGGLPIAAVPFSMPSIRGNLVESTCERCQPFEQHTCFVIHKQQ